MNREQAVSVLERALNASSKAGVFNLQDSATVFEAMEIVKQMYLETITVMDKTVPEKSKK